MDGEYDRHFEPTMLVVLKSGPDEVGDGDGNGDERANGDESGKVGRRNVTGTITPIAPMIQFQVAVILARESRPLNDRCEYRLCWKCAWKVPSANRRHTRPRCHQ